MTFQVFVQRLAEALPDGIRLSWEPPGRCTIFIGGSPSMIDVSPSLAREDIGQAARDILNYVQDVVVRDTGRPWPASSTTDGRFACPLVTESAAGWSVSYGCGSELLLDLGVVSR